MRQQDLFQCQNVVTPKYGKEDSIQSRFEQFCALNSWVLEALESLARSYQRRGWKHIGIGHLFEVVRYEHSRQTNSADGFKLNNDFRSRYVRLIQQLRPELADLFETRELRAA